MDYIYDQKVTINRTATERAREDGAQGPSDHAARGDDTAKSNHLAMRLPAPSPIVRAKTAPEKRPRPRHPVHLTLP